MRIRITANDNPSETRITNAETGEVLLNFKEAYWEQRGPDRPSEMRLISVARHEIDVEGKPIIETEISTKTLVQILVRRLIKKVF